MADGAFYSEHDPFAAAWLRELIREGLIPAGVVDERDIRDVPADDIRGFHAVHLFAGIGGWPYALRLAGWPDDRPVWTGSCPCQPFSSAGKRKGQGDDRHLWPAMFRLVRECRPVVVFGEQVEGAVRLGWLDGVSADLEGEGYAVGSVVLGAHSVGAPHQRQRLYWVADAAGGGREDEQGVADNGRSMVGTLAGTGGRDGGGDSAPRVGGGGVDGGAGRVGVGLADGTGQRRPEGHQDGCRCGCGAGSAGDGTGPAAGGGPCELADADRDAGGGVARDDGGTRREPGVDAGVRGHACGAAGVPLGHTGSERLEGRGLPGRGREGERLAPAAGGDAGFWDAFDLIPCRDGKARRVEPGSFPLADGVPGRVGLLRGYGNAICPQTAARFVRAFLDVTGADR